MKRYPPKPLPYDADGDAIFDEAFSVASTTECTGLIPSAPASGAEADSYSDIYDIPLADDPTGTDHGLQTPPKRR